jgi:uncharacterized membrane protein
MPNIHPLLVHFPIALIFAVLLIDLIGLLSRRENYLRVGTILTLFALAGGIAAVGTGLFAEESVWHSPTAGELIERHELLGFTYLGIIVLLAILRLAAGKKFMNTLAWVGWIIAFAAAGVVSLGAYIGGELVYRHGTGVTGMQERLIDSSHDNEQSPYDEEYDDEEEETEESGESE